MLFFLHTSLVHAEIYQNLKNKLEKSSNSEKIEILLKIIPLDIQNKNLDDALRHAKEAYAILNDTSEKDKTAKSLLYIGTIYFMQNNFLNALDPLQRAEALGAIYFDTQERFTIHLTLAKIYTRLKDFSNADERFMRARQLALENRDNDLYATFLYEKGLTYQNTYPERAYSDFSEALSLYSSDSRNPLFGLLLSARAELLLTMKKSDKALEDARTLETTAKNNNEPELHIQALFIISSIEIDSGELDTAFDALYEIIDISQKNNFLSAEARAYNVLGELFDELRYTEKAIEFFNKSILLSEQTLNIYEKTKTLLLLTKTYLNHEKYDLALKTSDEALQHTRLYSYSDLLPYCYLYKGILFNHSHAYNDAIASLAQAQKLFSEIGNFSGSAETLYYFSHVYDNQEKLQQALYAIEEAGRLAKKHNEDDIQLKIVSQAGTLYAKKGDHKKAVMYFERYAAMKNRQDTLMQRFSERQLRYESEQNRKEIEKMEKKQRIKEHSIIIHRILIVISVSGMLFLTFLLFKKATVRKETADIAIDATFMKYHKISGREQDIIKLIALGYTNKEVSEKLFIAEGTVKQHMNTIYKKMHVRNRIELLNTLKGYSPPDKNDQRST